MGNATGVGPPHKGWGTHSSQHPNVLGIEGKRGIQGLHNNPSANSATNGPRGKKKRKQSTQAGRVPHTHARLGDGVVKRPPQA